MKGNCSLQECGLKDGLACELGHRTLEDCAHFQAAPAQAGEEAAEAESDDGSGQRLPWSGRALGLSDMMLVSARAPSSLVGLVGPFNAGKTTFLTSLFAHFARTGKIDKHSFAGSYTLEAWARLKRYTQWPTAKGPCFPPHTPDTGERVPSLLHLAFREGPGLVQDLLFTDAPGEWFTRWVRNQSAEESRGARWIASNATHFLFFVDRAALAGPEVGKVRQETLALARLLAEHLSGRPIIAVWSKSDEAVEESTEKPIREKLNGLFGEHKSLNLHAKDPATLEVLHHLLRREESSSTFSFPRSSLTNGSPFLTYAGRKV